MTEGNFMACSCTVAKVNQQQSSSTPAAQFNSHWWYFVPLILRCHTKAPSYSWLKRPGWPELLCSGGNHAKYRHFQSIWTQSQYQTPICTLVRLLNGKLRAPPGICQLYLFQYNRSLKQTSIPLLLLCTLT